VADAKFAHRAIPAGGAPNKIADWSVHRTLRDHLGLARIKNAYSGGSAIGPDHFRFFHAIGVNLKQIYGQTEISGISVVHRSDDIRGDTVGKPIPETEVKITAKAKSFTQPGGVQRLLQMPKRRSRPCAMAGFIPATQVSSPSHLSLVSSTAPKT
jgi:long-chain acyl-CoA synthetase